MSSSFSNVIVHGNILLSTSRGRFSHGQKISFITDSARWLSRRFGKDLQTTFNCIENLLQSAFYLVLQKLQNKWTKSPPTTSWAMFISTEVLPKKMGGFLHGSHHALQRIHSWKLSTNFSWEKSCVLNTIIFWQSAITFKKVLMVKYAANTTQ